MPRERRSARLVGIAAVIACACFIGFLWKIGLIDYDEPAGMLISGPVFIVAAIVLNRVPGVSRPTIGSFLLQASLAAMATGKLLFILGLSDLFTTPGRCRASRRGRACPVPRRPKPYIPMRATTIVALRIFRRFNGLQIGSMEGHGLCPGR